MQVKTSRFGTIEVDGAKIINFPKGVPGFENIRRFFILPVEGMEDLHWMQAIDEPTLALLVGDPFKYFGDYSCSLPEQDVQELDIKNPTEALVLTTITIPPGDPQNTTANLVAPLVINTRTNKAKQVILPGSPYTTKHRLFPDIKSTVAGEGK